LRPVPPTTNPHKTPPKPPTQPLPYPLLKKEPPEAQPHTNTEKTTKTPTYRSLLETTPPASSPQPGYCVREGLSRERVFCHPGGIIRHFFPRSIFSNAGFCSTFMFGCLLLPIRSPDRSCFYPVLARDGCGKNCSPNYKDYKDDNFSPSWFTPFVAGWCDPFRPTWPLGVWLKHEFSFPLCYPRDLSEWTRLVSNLACRFPPQKRFLQPKTTTDSQKAFFPAPPPLGRRLSPFSLVNTLW